MTFDEWLEVATDGWYLGRMMTDDEKGFAEAAWHAATLAEREACAKLCEEELIYGWKPVGERIAAAIRARSNSGISEASAATKS